jgi:hypothetical protein
MVCPVRLRPFALIAALVFVAFAVPSASSQGLQNVLRAQSRVFPTVGPGVAAIKRDSTGRYFILAEPASVISVFDSAGERVDQFPNAKSHGTTIRYAVGIDVDSRGRLFVVDRGDNSIKIFAPDGALVALVHVNAPTSVVALSDGQFAVTTLQSQRLVEIMDEKGKIIRTFGDPADHPDARTPSQPVMDRGRISGDPSGNIYFAFTSLSDPTLERFDRFGYSAYGTAISASEFVPSSAHNGHEIDLGYTMSGLYGPTSVGAWTDLHSLTSVSVGNRARRGPSSRGTSSSQANPSSSSSSSPSSSTSSSTDSADASSSVDGNVISYNANGGSDPLDLSSPIFGGTGTPDFASAFDQGLFMPGMFGMGFGNMFHDGMFRGFHGDGGGADSAFGGARPDVGGAGTGPGGAGGHFPDGFEGFHGRPGFANYRAAATVRVGLDDPSKNSLEKPVITAVGVEPNTQEVWAAISDVLVHLDQFGNRIDTYYPVISEGRSMKITSILVEPNRILVATDPWGIYEFARPDKRPQSPAPQNSIVAQPLPSPTPPPAAH